MSQPFAVVLMLVAAFIGSTSKAQSLGFDPSKRAAHLGLDISLCAADFASIEGRGSYRIRSIIQACLPPRRIVVNTRTAEKTTEIHVSPVTGKNAVKLSFSNLASPVRGFGVQFNPSEIGRKLPLYVTEQGIGRDRQPLTAFVNLAAPGAAGTRWTTYAPGLVFFDSTGIAIAISGYSAVEADLSEGSVTILNSAGSVDILVYTFDRFQSYFSFLGAVTGRQKNLPSWLGNGMIAGLQGGQAKVQDIVSKAQTADVAISAVWLQDWVGQRETIAGHQLWWSWSLDKTLYPRWDSLVNFLKERRIKLLLYFNPYLVADRNGNIQELYETAKRRGFLIRNSDQTIYEVRNSDFSAAMIDLFNPEARAWITRIIRERARELGASGWMADYGEALPLDGLSYRGRIGVDDHNLYAELWSRANIDAASEIDEPLVFNRSGYTTGAKNSQMLWLGDQLVDWDEFDGFKSAIFAATHAGFAGYGNVHFDAGGYTTIQFPLWPFPIVRSEELLRRWSETSIFTMLFRTHEGNIPRANIQFYDSGRLLAVFSRYSQFFVCIQTYRAHLEREYQLTGMPPIVPTWVHYKDAHIGDRTDVEQYSFGKNVVHAPVSSPGRHEVVLNVPAEGRWFDPYSGAELRPGPYRMAAPLGRPAFIVRPDALFALSFFSSCARRLVE